jgi:hypothetical protein
MHPDFEGERTPEEQVAFDAEQAKRAAVAAAAGTTVPDNPTGTPQSTY